MLEQVVVLAVVVAELFVLHHGVFDGELPLRRQEPQIQHEQRRSRKRYYTGPADTAGEGVSEDEVSDGIYPHRTHEQFGGNLCHLVVEVVLEGAPIEQSPLVDPEFQQEGHQNHCGSVRHGVGEEGNGVDLHDVVGVAAG